MSQTHAPTEERTRTRDRRSTFGWLGLLTGPIAWAIQLYLSWAFGEVIACAPANRPTGIILGLEVNTVAAIMNGILLGLTLLAGLLSLLELRRLRARMDRTPGDRATWLATAGVMSAVIFAVLIAASFVPIGLIGGCS